MDKEPTTIFQQIIKSSKKLPLYTASEFEIPNDYSREQMEKAIQGLNCKAVCYIVTLYQDKKRFLVFKVKNMGQRVIQTHSFARR